MSPPSRSKGAILLVRQEHTQPELARRLGVSNGIVAMWQTGARTPGPKNRRAMFDQFAIPVDAWDAFPEKSPPPRRDTASAGKATVFDHIETLETMVENLMSSADDDESSTPLERAKVMSSLASTLTSLRRLKGEAVAEIRVLRHPKWAELKNAVLTALEPHPDALADVVDALTSAEDPATG